jgi:DNA-binding CsgD family transcriptional regulator
VGGVLYDRPVSRFVLDMGSGWVRLTQGLWRIGRDATCEVHLDDPSVSRRHASLRVGARGVEVVDAGSRNGVRINGRRIHGTAPLQGGDTLAVGTVRLRLLDRDPSEVDLGAAATKPLPRLDSQPPAGDPGGDRLTLLSPREREVLARIARGETQRAVADALGLSVKTVETYRARIGQKLELRTRAELVRFALEAGLLAPT